MTTESKHILFTCLAAVGRITSTGRTQQSRSGNKVLVVGTPGVWGDMAVIIRDRQSITAPSTTILIDKQDAIRLGQALIELAGPEMDPAGLDAVGETPPMQ